MFNEDFSLSFRATYLTDQCYLVTRSSILTAGAMEFDGYTNRRATDLSESYL